MSRRHSSVDTLRLWLVHELDWLEDEARQAAFQAGVQHHMPFRIFRRTSVGVSKHGFGC